LPACLSACLPACLPVTCAVHCAVLAFSHLLHRAVRVELRVMAKVRASDSIYDFSRVVRAIHGISGRDDTARRLSHLTAVAFNSSISQVHMQ
jgi:hypothetical protein